MSPTVKKGNNVPNHRIMPRDGRLAWFQAKADPELWHEYFVDAVDEEIIKVKSRKGLDQDGLGRIFARELPRSGKMLEAGSGPGHWVATLEGNGYDIEGVEYSTKLVDRLKEVAPTLPIRHGDVLALEVPDGHYAAYISIGVVEHREEGPEPFLDEAFRVLEPGGVGVITVPLYGPVRRTKALLHLYDKTTDDLPFYQYAFTPAEIIRYITDAGFTVRSTATYSFGSLLRQEVRGFAWLTRRTWGRKVQQNLERALGRYDGHMIAIIAVKPPAP